jgi:hypothetical protein
MGLISGVGKLSEELFRITFEFGKILLFTNL